MDTIKWITGLVLCLLVKVLQARVRLLGGREWVGMLLLVVRGDAHIYERMKVTYVGGLGACQMLWGNVLV